MLLEKTACLSNPTIYIGQNMAKDLENQQTQTDGLREKMIAVNRVTKVVKGAVL